MSGGQVDDLQINELKSLNCFGVFSNLDNAYYDDDDNELHTDTQAQAYFQRNVDVGGNLRLGIEKSTTTNGVTTYTDTGGNILVKIEGVTYTITPTILKYLSTITNDYATTIQGYASKASPEFTGSLSINSNSYSYKFGTRMDLNQNGIWMNMVNDSNAVIQGEFQGLHYNNICINPYGANVGIGTLTPSRNLDVNGSLNANTIYENGTLLSSTYASKASPEFTGTPKAPTPSTTTNNTEIATCEFVKAQGYLTSVTPPDLSPYALKASPTFTGTPIAPTPSSSTNNTEIATTAFVKAQGYLTSVTPPDLSSYAPIASPTFTGTPKAPTPSSSTNNTEIATTAFVKAQGYLTSVTPPDLSPYALKASPEFTGTPVSTTPIYTDSSTKIATTRFIYDILQNNDLTLGNGATSTVMDCSTTFNDTILMKGGVTIDNGVVFNNNGGPDSIYDNSSRVPTTAWIHSLIESLITEPKTTQYIIAYTDGYLVFPLTPTYNILGKKYYSSVFQEPEQFAGYFVNSSSIALQGGYGWNDGIWKAYTEGRYLIEIKLKIEYQSGGDNNLKLYVKDVNNNIISSYDVYIEGEGSEINKAILVFIQAEGYFTIIKEGSDDINFTWGDNYFTATDKYAFLKVTRKY